MPINTRLNSLGIPSRVVNQGHLAVLRFSHALETSTRILQPVRPFIESLRLLWPLLTSPAASSSPCGDASPAPAGHRRRSPRVMRTDLHAYVCRIYAHDFRARTGLRVSWPPYPSWPPLCGFCSSDQRFAIGFLQIPPRDGHPCLWLDTSRYQGMLGNCTR